MEGGHSGVHSLEVQTEGVGVVPTYSDLKAVDRTVLVEISAFVKLHSPVRPYSRGVVCCNSDLWEGAGEEGHCCLADPSQNEVAVTKERTSWRTSRTVASAHWVDL